MIRKVKRKWLHFVLLRKLHQYMRNGEYQDAYLVSDRLCALVGRRNVFYWLVKSHLAIMSDKVGESGSALECFYNAVSSDPELLSTNHVTEHERLWMLAFAEYTLVTLSGKGVKSIGLGEEFHVNNLDAIEFDHVRGLYKRMLRPEYISEIEKAYKLVETECSDSNLPESIKVVELERSEFIDHIAGAIQRLLERRNGDAFVIISDKATERFVQFAGGPSQQLLFDLPSQTLDPDEFVRAQALLKTFNIHFDEWGVPNDSEGSCSEREGSFSQIIEQDSSLAAQLAWRVLTEVYELDEPMILEIQEN